MAVEVHPLTKSPTEAWEEIKKTQHVMRFKVKTPKEPPPENKIRIVCMSDTHSLTSHMKWSVPHGDVFIHAGDFTRSGKLKEVRDFNTWLGTLSHKHKIVIAGNHELTLDDSFKRPNNFGVSDNISHRRVGREPTDFKAFLKEYGELDEIEICAASTTKSEIMKELVNCVYLEDSSVTLYGLNFFGSPWQPTFGGWAFNVERGKEILEKWDKIPTDTDILITHGPPVGYGDHCATCVRAGCVELLNTVQKRVIPKYHIYGHIHEGYGVRSDGKVVFINASTCDINYMPNNKPVVIDVNIPEGFSRESS